jgi:hypothetical protein
VDGPRASKLQRIAAPVAGAALVLALAAAGWSIHRRLPEGDPAQRLGRGEADVTALRIRLLRPPGYEAEAKVSIQLYSVSVEAARREFESERRPGVRFDEFLLRRMGGREPISVEVGAGSEVVIPVPQGRWWVHATLEGPDELTWRLPVNVSGREKTVDLTPENIYTRAKSF